MAAASPVASRVGSDKWRIASLLTDNMMGEWFKVVVNHIASVSSQRGSVIDLGQRAVN